MTEFRMVLSGISIGLMSTIGFQLRWLDVDWFIKRAT